MHNTDAAYSNTRQDRKCIKELERDLLRKDRALAETAALLVLSKEVAAIFNKGEDARSVSMIARARPRTFTRRTASSSF